MPKWKPGSTTHPTWHSCKRPAIVGWFVGITNSPSGDACHPMLPYLAQGANSSLEDGAVLGLLLGHMKSKAQLPQILRLYESLRKSRGEAIVRETFKQVSIRTRTSVLFLTFRRDMTSTCPMARSRRSVTRSFCLSWEKSSKGHFLADGEWCIDPC